MRYQDLPARARRAYAEMFCVWPWIDGIPPLSGAESDDHLRDIAVAVMNAHQDRLILLTIDDVALALALARFEAAAFDELPSHSLPVMHLVRLTGDD